MTIKEIAKKYNLDFGNDDKLDIKDFLIKKGHYRLAKMIDTIEKRIIREGKNKENA